MIAVAVAVAVDAGRLPKGREVSSSIGIPADWQDMSPTPPPPPSQTPQPFPPPNINQSQQQLDVLKSIRTILVLLLLTSIVTMLGTCGSCSALNSTWEFRGTP